MSVVFAKSPFGKLRWWTVPALLWATLVAAQAQAALTVSPTTLANGTQNVAYSRTITASGGTTPYTFSVTGGALPSGLALSSAGVLSGTPTVNGSFSFTVTANDSAADTGTRNYTLVIAAPVIAVTPATLPNGRQNVAYSRTITATGGTAPYTYAVTSGALPAGLTLSTGGALTGTPTVNGSFSFTVRATDAQGYSGSRTYTLVVAVPAIALAPTTLPSGRQNVAYSRTITASGGTAPYTYAVTAGALPAGLTLSAGGTLAGTPTVNGSFAITITATDSQGYAGSRAYTLVIAVPAIAVTPTSLTSGRQNVAYSRTLAASGGTAPYDWAVTAGALPAGLTLSSAGVLSGTPTVNGSFTFTATATDSQGYPGSRAYTLVIAVPTIAVTPTSLTSGRQNVVYSQTLSASGGAAPYGWAVTVGALPAGLTLSGAGVLSGTPTVNGTFTFTATATDSQGYSGSRAYSLVIAVPLITVIPASPLPAGRQFAAYSQTIGASGGATPYTFVVSAGALPAGLSLSGAGLLSGVPTASGSFSFTIRATDSQGYSGTRAYTLSITAGPVVTLSPTTLPAGNEALSYSQVIAASGGTAPYSYAVTSGALPPGLTLTSGGTLSGTPISNGSYGFTVTATDAQGYLGARTYALSIIAAPTITLAPSTLPTANENLAYSQTVTATGGTAPYGYSVTSGALPPGLTLSSGGVLSGSPTGSGSFNFTIIATDAMTYTGAQSYTLTVVAAPTITIAPTSLPAANENLAYSQTVTATGGTAPYGYAVMSGALPPGLTLSSGGVLSGSPTASGSFNFTVTATDALTYTGTQAYTVTVVAAPTITIAPTSLPAANEKLAYSQGITASGGNAPYSYALTSGALPPGLTLSSGGVLSGSPTASGSFNFTVTATDALTYTGTQAYTVTVVAAPTITLAPTSMPAANENLAYSQTVTATGGTAPYGYAVSSGALPPGLTLSSGGVLSGSPTASGSFNFTVTATDAMTYTASQSYTLAVGAASTITIAPSTLPVANQDLAYSQAITASGGTEPYGYAVTSGALPPGLTLSSDGQLAGTPTTNGTFSFTATATDAIGYAGAVSYSLGIDAAPTIVVSPGSLQAAVYGVPYQQAFTAAGSAGPFTFAVTSGALPPGMNLSEDGMLSGTPTAAGSYDFTVTATDPQTYAGSSDFSLVVEQRPDPTDDPTLRNSVQAQVDAMQRLAFAQLQNVNGRLEQLRSCHDSAATMSVRVEGQGDFDAATGQGEQDSNCDRALAFWVAGTIIYGGDGSRADVRAPALTMGADLRVGDDLVLGLGFGAGSDSVRPGGDADNTADGYSFMGYGSWHAGEVLRIEGALGYGTASLSGRRVTSYDGARVSGKRDAGQLFGSLTLAGDLLFGRMSVQPYLRTDYQSASLDPYVERGGGPLALRFHATDTDTLQYAGGLRVVWSLPVPSGLLQPMLRYEYRSLDGSDVDQAVSYADGIGGRYRLTLDGATQDTGVLGVGLGFTLADGVSGSLEYQTSYGDDLAADSMYTGNLSWSF